MDEANELERLATSSDNWDTYVSVVEETLPRLQDGQVRIEALVRLAQVYREKLEDADAALGHFKHVQELEPANRVALEAMEEIYEERGSWEALIEVLSRRSPLGETKKRNEKSSSGSEGSGETSLPITRQRLMYFAL